MGVLFTGFSGDSKVQPGLRTTCLGNKDLSGSDQQEKAFFKGMLSVSGPALYRLPFPLAVSNLHTWGHCSAFCKLLKQGC